MPPADRCIGMPARFAARWNNRLREALTDYWLSFPLSKFDLHAKRSGIKLLALLPCRRSLIVSLSHDPRISNHGEKPSRQLADAILLAKVQRLLGQQLPTEADCCCTGDYKVARC